MITALASGFYGIGFIVVVAALWELLASVTEFQYFPPVSEVLSEATSMIVGGELNEAIGHTLQATVLGWVLGSVVGIVLGLSIALSARLAHYSLASLEALRAIPAISFVPVAILILGFSVRMEVAIAAYVCMWQVFVNTMAGAQTVTRTHRDVTQMLRLGRLESIWKVTIPTAVPYIVTGMKLGLSTSLALVIVAEMVGNPAGLGYEIVQFQGALQPSSMFAVILVVGIVGLLLNVLYEYLSRLPHTVRASMH